MIGGQHDLGSMIDDDHAVAQFLQSTYCTNDERDLLAMQSGRRFVDDTQRPRHARPQRRGEHQSPSLTSRQCRRAAIQREMTESEIADNPQSLADVVADQPSQ